jgi:hypothetical protein
MSIKQLALSLNKLEKVVGALPESTLQLQLKEHIDAMLTLLLKERVQANEAKNFTLKPDAPVKTSRQKKKTLHSSTENLTKASP